jgi:TolB protein
MANAGPDDGHDTPQEWAPTRVHDGGRRRAILLGALPVIGLMAAVTVALLAPAGDPGGDIPAPAAAASSAPAGASPESTDPADQPSSGATSAPGTPSVSAAPWVPGPPGRIAYVGPTGRLAVIDDETGETVAIPIPGIVTGPPAWSPDGTRLAVIVTDPEATRLYVVAMPSDAAAGDPVPRVVYSSDGQRPFYLYWAPDGERVGFLANDLDRISLRTAPADGSAPEDGPGRDGVLRRGSPLYFAWTAADRLLLHVGAGADAFTGEIDIDGESAGAVVRATGDFRTAASSPGATVVAYVTGDADPAVVLGARDGAEVGRMPVFGPAALGFDPAGTTLATIAANARSDNSADFPFGPLRLLDAGTGDARTLIDESVLAFWWSPDGRTIAALRLAPVADPSSASRSGVAIAATDGEPAAAAPEPTLEVRLTFVDAATGDVRSDRAVKLGSDFVAAVLPYFDQYALSHRVWSPDSQAIVLPLEDADGRTQATVLDADGADPRPIADARQALWAP